MNAANNPCSSKLASECHDNIPGASMGNCNGNVKRSIRVHSMYKARIGNWRGRRVLPMYVDEVELSAQGASCRHAGGVLTRAR